MAVSFQETTPAESCSPCCDDGFADDSMCPISDLSRTARWRATTATGETEVFHLKIIAHDWAGTGGTVEAVKAADRKALQGGGEIPPPE